MYIHSALGAFICIQNAWTKSWEIKTVKSDQSSAPMVNHKVCKQGKWCSIFISVHLISLEELKWPWHIHTFIKGKPQRVFWLVEFPTV